MRYNLQNLKDNYNSLIREIMMQGKLTKNRLEIDLPDSFDFKSEIKPIPVAIKLKPRPKGFGDSVENFIGVDTSAALQGIFKALFKKDCGCKKRKEFLNELIPYDTGSLSP